MVGRTGQRARTPQEDPGLNLEGRFGFQNLGRLNVLLLNVFLFLLTGWYLPPFPTQERTFHQEKEKTFHQEQRGDRVVVSVKPHLRDHA